MKKTYLTALIILSSVLYYQSYAQVCGVYPQVKETWWASPADMDFGFTQDSVNLFNTDTVTFIQGLDSLIDLQYLMPKKFDASAQSGGIVGIVDVQSITVNSVVGLPVGLQYSLDAAGTASGSSYSPQNYRFGAVSLCGTTFAPEGIYQIDVNITATISAGSGGETIPLYVRIISEGNPYFSMTPSLGCNTVEVDFASKVPSPNPIIYPINFEWDFTNDGTIDATGSSASYNYTTLGNHEVNFVYTLDEFYISAATMNATETDACFCDFTIITCLDGAEPYLRINAGNGDVSLPAGSGDNVTWTSLDIPISTTAIVTNFWEYDLVGGDDFLGSDIYTMANTLFDGQIISFSIGSCGSASLTISKRSLAPQNFIDTVKVYPSSTATATSSNGTSFCNGDSTTLDLGNGSFDFIQWYLDSLELVGETNATLTATASGNYYAEVLNAGSVCLGISNSIMIATDGPTTPVIVSSNTTLEINNPNSHSVQWFSNGIPIPGATSNELNDLSNGGPFSVVLTNANGCSTSSGNFTGCLGGYASAPNGTDVDGDVATTFEAIGFSYNSQTEIAWSVTPVADGMITTAADVAAINNANVYQGNGNQIDLLLDCNTLQGEGTYYLTPFLIEAVELPQFPFPTTDTLCEPSMSLDISFDCVNQDWEIGNASVVDPSGSPIDLLSLSPVPITYPIPPSLICDALGGSIPGVNLFDLAPNSNPNGTWQIEVKNSGSGPMNITIPAFEVTLMAADCGDISADMIYEYGPYDISIAAGETEALSIKVPPLPTNYPSIAASCSAFGTPVEIEVTNCVSAIEDLIEIEAINLYPNPNNGIFTLDFEMYEQNSVEVSILDISGRKVLNRNYDNVHGQFSEKFDLKNNLNTGFYFMEIKVGNYTTQKKFIVK